MSYHYQTVDSPVGPLHLVADDEALCVLTFKKTWPLFKDKFSAPEEKTSPILEKTKRQLTDYFDGKRRMFDLPMKLTGTPFQNKAWEALAKIPFGKTSTYKQQAAAIRSPRATRAVGRANGLNPICIVLPCHRVIGSDGALTGFAGGIKAKAILLKLEKNFQEMSPTTLSE